MRERKNPICVGPNCTRAQPSHGRYEGLCLRHAKAAGIVQQHIPWKTVHAELERILAGGWTLNAIEEDHAIYDRTLRDIKYHRRDRFKDFTYQALKEIPTLSPYRRPAWPLRRRVNALRAIGIPFAEIGRAIGEEPEKVQHLSYDRTNWATPQMDEKIRTYYTQHALDPRRKNSMTSAGPTPTDPDHGDQFPGADFLYGKAHGFVLIAFKHDAFNVQDNLRNVF